MTSPQIAAIGFRIHTGVGSGVVIPDGPDGVLISGSAAASNSCPGRQQVTILFHAGGGNAVGKSERSDRRRRKQAARDYA